jgi:deazaflavin-dependent oxidoreductase (nitroreductase family)
MGRYVNALRWLGEQKWFPAIGKPVFPRLDRFLYRLSSGRLTSVGPMMFPTLLLTTRGHRSGRTLTTPLFYVRDTGCVIVAATNFGLPQHPRWSENLLREPNAQVQIGADLRSYRARLASSEEIARAWPRLVEFWPAYDRYKERSGRDIRVFVLEPCRAPSNAEAQAPSR